MSDTFWTPIADVATPLWCDQTAWKYAAEKPLTFAGYKQLVDVRNVLVPESEHPLWDPEKPLTTGEIKAFKEAINAYQHNYPYWRIQPGDEDFFDYRDIDDLRRLAGYPNTQEQCDTWGFEECRWQGLDYTTDGMKVFTEAQNDAGGWSDWVGQVVGPPATHRFWMWTRYLDMGVWDGTSVGIIDCNGRICAPFCGTPLGNDWSKPPQTGGDVETWHLIQLRQDIHPLLNRLDFDYKSLKGRIHWLAYTAEVTNTAYKYEECGAGVVGCRSTSVTVANGLTRETEEIHCGPVQTPLCWDAWDQGSATETFSIEYAEEIEDIITGGYFRTWEWYMDQL